MELYFTKKRILLRQFIARETSARMNLIQEYSLFHSRVFIHYFFYFIQVRIEYSNSGNAASIINRLLSSSAA
jgi:hypothetical protein